MYCPSGGELVEREEISRLGFYRRKGLAGPAAHVPCCGVDGRCGLARWHCCLGIMGQLGAQQTAASSSMALCCS